jgi:uncharacterized membrane protein
MTHSIAKSLCLLSLLFFVICPTESAAWGQLPSPRSSPKHLTSGFSRWRKSRPSSLRSTEQEQDTVIPNVNEKRLIEVINEIELPFSAEVAYDAYSNLARQPTWSSWLHSVEYFDESQTSKWTMKFMGVGYSWTAIAVKNERPHTIQWQSTSGLQNFGTVRFHQEHVEKPTVMKMNMTFVAPRAIAGLFRRSKGLANFVQQKMIADSMVNFRDVVQETNSKQKE